MQKKTELILLTKQGKGIKIKLIPVIGLTINPVRPLKLPSKNPSIPFYLAPSIGLVITPVIPFSKPLKILVNPYPKP